MLDGTGKSFTSVISFQSLAIYVFPTQDRERWRGRKCGDERQRGRREQEEEACDDNW